MKSHTLTIIVILLSVLTLFGLVLVLFPSESTPKHYSTENYNEDLQLLSEIITDLQTEQDLDDIVAQTKEKKFVLLGESSHGTSEYYQWRARISKRLISENNFSYIAIEGDWPNIYEVNKYVKVMDNSASTAQEALGTLNRWPPWMWNNEEFLELVEWVREHNEKLPSNKRVGIYGMDMQDLSSAIEKKKEILRRINPELKERIKQDLTCIEEYDGDIQEYAQAYLSEDISCEENIENILNEFKNTYSENEIFNSEDIFKTYKNILAIKYAEEYARKLATQDSGSWNTRVQYMKETVTNLSLKYGEDAKGLLWAHNTHLGDARATEMVDVGMVNMGQLLREKFTPEQVYIIGFGTYKGQVVASFQWGHDLQILNLPEAVSGSIEDFLNNLDSPSFIIPLYQDNIPNIFTQQIGHRAKGVVYNPNNDHNHYVQTILSQRYDSFIFINETSALNPL